MNLWIKVCGNTSLADAQLAAEAGANAVGFVFAPSPRQVTQQQVAAFVPQLPAALEKIGVFVDASFGEITSAVENCGLTGIQLHWGAPRELPMKLRLRLGPRLRILRVVYADGGGALVAFSPESAKSVDAILIDSHTTYAPGGTGVAFDWTAAGKKLLKSAPRCGCRSSIASGRSEPLPQPAVRRMRSRSRMRSGWRRWPDTWPWP